jgi:hypothetical protein
MSELASILRALDRAANLLSDAATELTTAMLIAGETPLGDDSYVLTEVVDAELGELQPHCYLDAARKRRDPRHGAGSCSSGRARISTGASPGPTR